MHLCLLSISFFSRTAGKVFREPAGIESICNSLHQASNSLQVCKMRGGCGRFWNLRFRRSFFIGYILFTHINLIIPKENLETLL